MRTLLLLSPLLLSSFCWVDAASTKSLVNEVLEGDEGDEEHLQFYDKTKADEETALTEEDFARARVVRRAKRDNEDVDVDDSAMYNSERFEGDIVNSGLSSKTVRSFVGDEPVAQVQGVMRNAVRQSYLKWPGGRIPYTISTQYSPLSKQRIAEAIDEYSQLTCIQFTPRGTRDSEYIHITPDDGCYSLVGRTGGKQIVSLGDGCIQKGIIVHELMHTVGFFHEQSRADRDDYITVNWGNVENGLQDQFDKYSLSMIDHLGTKYDYGSIMHYAKNAFSKNGLPTITPKQSGATIGQRRGFSENDLYKINKLYSCAQSTAGNGAAETQRPAAPATTTTPGNKCRDKRADCVFMARGGNCDYGYNRKFMLANCPASCGACQAQELPCEDSRSWCGRWAMSGMCTNPVFQDYMFDKCRASCELC